MTVIVRPITPPETTSDEVITDYLTRLLGTVSFEQFEATVSGDLTILGTTFHMRIGTFLAVPTQAIMACEQFVKMLPRSDFDKQFYTLNPLDPLKPEDCLYSDNSIRRWQPTYSGPQPSGLYQGYGQQTVALAGTTVLGPISQQVRQANLAAYQKAMKTAQKFQQIPSIDRSSKSFWKTFFPK